MLNSVCLFAEQHMSFQRPPAPAAVETKIRRMSPPSTSSSNLITFNGPPLLDLSVCQLGSCKRKGAVFFNYAEYTVHTLLVIHHKCRYVGVNSKLFQTKHVTDWWIVFAYVHVTVNRLCFDQTGPWNQFDLQDHDITSIAPTNTLFSYALLSKVWPVLQTAHRTNTVHLFCFDFLGCETLWEGAPGSSLSDGLYTVRDV